MEREDKELNCRAETCTGTNRKVRHGKFTSLMHSLFPKATELMSGLWCRRMVRPPLAETHIPVYITMCWNEDLCLFCSSLLPSTWSQQPATCSQQGEEGGKLMGAVPMPGYWLLSKPACSFTPLQYPLSFLFYPWSWGLCVMWSWRSVPKLKGSREVEDIEKEQGMISSKVLLPMDKQQQQNMWMQLTSTGGLSLR